MFILLLILLFLLILYLCAVFCCGLLSARLFVLSGSISFSLSYARFVKSKENRKKECSKG